MGLQEFEIENDPELFVAAIDRRPLGERIKSFVNQKLRKESPNKQLEKENTLQTIMDEPLI